MHNSNGCRCVMVLDGCFCMVGREKWVEETIGVTSKSCIYNIHGNGVKNVCRYSKYCNYFTSTRTRAQNSSLDLPFLISWIGVVRGLESDKNSLESRILLDRRTVSFLARQIYRLVVASFTMAPKVKERYDTLYRDRIYYVLG
jgi:hypothetical protein